MNRAATTQIGLSTQERRRIAPSIKRAEPAIISTAAAFACHVPCPVQSMLKKSAGASQPSASTLAMPEKERLANPLAVLCALPRCMIAPCYGHKSIHEHLHSFV